MSDLTQPICERDWRRIFGDRRPFRVVEVEDERCAWCGETTRSGIYLRVDPETLARLPHPTLGR